MASKTVTRSIQISHQPCHSLRADEINLWLTPSDGTNQSLVIVCKQANHVKAFNGMCVRLTSIPFPVIWSSVLISVTREWRYCGLVYKFFLINNIELQCSIVWCRKYHKSWSNGAAELTWASHLGRFTLWHNGRRATQLGKFTLWPDNGYRARQLSRFTLLHKRSRTKPGLVHAPGIAHIFQRQWRTMLKNMKA